MSDRDVGPAHHRSPHAEREAYGRRLLCAAALALSLSAGACGQTPPGGMPPAGAPPVPGAAPAPPSDIELVERLQAARKEYQTCLEHLHVYYQSVNDAERARWVEEELRQYHRIPKQAYRLELDVPPPTLQAAYNVPEANDLYRRAMQYKDKGWGNEYVDNQRRAEILLQHLLTSYPQSDKIDDAAYQLGDIYESRPYRQYRRAAAYYERCFQWNPNTQFDARLRAARLYDKQLSERSKAVDLYKEVLNRESNEKWRQEADKRVKDLTGKQ